MLSLKKTSIKITTFLWIKFYIIFLIVREMRKFLEKNMEYVILLTWFITIGLLSYIVLR